MISSLKKKKVSPFSLLASEVEGVSNYSELLLCWASKGGAKAFSPFFSLFTLKKVGLGVKGGFPEAPGSIFGDVETLVQTRVSLLSLPDFLDQSHGRLLPIAESRIASSLWPLSKLHIPYLQGLESNRGGIHCPQLLIASNTDKPALARGDVNSQAHSVGSLWVTPGHFLLCDLQVGNCTPQFPHL